MSKKNNTQKRLSEAEWIEIEILAKRGEMTLAEIGRRFGISKSAVSQGLRRRGIVYGSEAKEVRREFQEKVSEDNAKRIEEILKFKEKYIQYNDVIAKLLMETLIKTKQNNIPFANILKDLVALRNAANTLSLARDNAFHLYGLYREPDVEKKVEPINIGVYTKEEIEELIRKKNNEVKIDYLKEIEREVNLDDID